MDIIIESFKRLYASGQINEKVLRSLFQKGSISETDLEYILKEEGDE